MTQRLPEKIRLERRGNSYAIITDGTHRGVADDGDIERILRPATRWLPMERKDTDPSFVRNPDLEEVNTHFGVRPADEIWVNNIYQVSVRLMIRNGETEPPPNREGMLHLSIHRHDRYPIGDWRHMQQIKNEIAGEDRWAVEVYPSEEYLVDTANEYHLWVLDAGADVPFALHEGLVTSDETVERFNATRDESQGKRGRQREWQPGLTMGRGPTAQIMSPELENELMKATGRNRDR